MSDCAFIAGPSTSSGEPGPATPVIKKNFLESLYA